jgi:hypothetical protein
MRMIVLGAVIALGAGLTGVSSASATPMTSAAIDEAAGAVSLTTKTFAASCKTVPGNCSHRRHHHHHHYTATTTSPGQARGKGQPTTTPTQGGSPTQGGNRGY